ncbi:MAG: cellulose binding domain-containing protein [Cellulosilyticum sp.]|nr:cellulose binding domain-containing protein [Cellulosilyticum sp.]
MSDKVTFSFKLQSDWGDGFTGEFLITNNTDRPINNWELTFTWNATITSYYTCKVKGQVGNTTTIYPLWDKTIAAGETRNFGFQGAPGNIKDEPTDFKLKCDEFTTEVPLANITILEYTREKLGKVAGTTRCTVAFKADQDLLAWEARANGGTGVGIGLLVGEGSTLAAGEIGTFDVDTEELTLGDKEYTIKVYGKNQGGEWST